MHIEEFRNYCLSKKGVTESFPFDNVTLVFKVMDKVFAITGTDRIPFKVNLKCDPELAIALREQYPEVTPGYHMNKKHWNTVTFDAFIDTNELLTWIDNSYNLVVQGLTKKMKETLATL